MTNKELIIIKQYFESLLETAFARGIVRMGGCAYGQISKGDAEEFVRRIAVLVDDEGTEE